MVDRLRYDPQIVDSMLWKFDSAVEQVRESKGESEIAASAGAFVGGGLEGKAEQAARSVAEVDRTICCGSAPTKKPFSR